MAASWHDEAPGGANKLPTDFARFLASRRRHITYLCANTDHHLPERETIDGVELRRYRAPGAPPPSVANLVGHFRAARRLTAAILSESQIGTLLGHAPLQYLGALQACGPARRCYAVHSPFVAELQANHEGRPSMRQKLAWWVAGKIETRIYSRSDLVHCDSAYTLGLIRRAYPRSLGDKGIVLPAWVDVDRFSAVPTEARIVRQRLGPPWDADAPTFFTLRRLVPRMGLDTLISAAALLACEGHVFRLVIGGDGPQRTVLEKQVAEANLSDRVAFLGRIPETSLVDCFRAADCLVLPTRALECFGLIVLEAFATGVPVIGVQVGAIPEVMGDQFHAWLAPGGDVPGLAERMREFLLARLQADPEQLRSRACQFRFETLAEEHERVLLKGGTELGQRSALASV